jgi:hypothetical protein
MNAFYLDQEKLAIFFGDAILARVVDILFDSPKIYNEICLALVDDGIILTEDLLRSYLRRLQYEGIIEKKVLKRRNVYTSVMDRQTFIAQCLEHVFQKMASEYPVELRMVLIEWTNQHKKI